MQNTAYDVSISDWSSGVCSSDLVEVYGVRGKEKSLIVARVLPENMEDFSQWRFWDGKTWNQDMQQTAGIVSAVSNELSVSPLPDGRYALVFQKDAMSPIVEIGRASCRERVCKSV